MLDPSECFAGPVSAAKQITLVLPRTEYEHRCLIVINDEKPFAICLDELDRLGRFRAFQCNENDAWKGLHIPGVRIELDETSLHDADRHYTPLGSMVRSEDKLAMRVNLEGRHYADSASLFFMEGLPQSAPHLSACFTRWQVVLGESDNKRVLLRIDAATKPTA